MRGITKEFPGVKALDDVNFTVKTGEIHCLVGENGAGKSTPMKVLSGIHRYGSYQGDIIFNGEVMRFHSIRDSENAGISIINQELALVPELSVAENIFFGHEIMKGRLIDWNETMVQAEKYLKQVRLNVNPRTPIRELRVGSQQLVEIAKSLSKHAKLMILDEPTSSLNEEDSANLLNLLRELRQQGVTIIMISHRLKEVCRSRTPSPCCGMAPPSARWTPPKSPLRRIRSSATWSGATWPISIPSAGKRTSGTCCSR